ncbi:MAG: PorV/PorQ family protein [Fibrobacter sp.]|nr:PorV/PorQ family protein [Fibrobacter sp.]
MIKKLLATTAILSSIALAGEHWNVDLGGVTMKFLSMQVSGRSSAMSGAGVADPSRTAEISRNPLAMSTVNEAELGLNHLMFGDGATDNFFSAYYGYPLEVKGYKLAVTGAVDFIGYGDIEGRDENGALLGSYGAYAWSLQAGVGSRNNVFNWALSVRFASQTIDDESAIAVLGDIGGSFKVNKYLAFGTTLTNFGYMGDYDGVDEAEPMALQAGVTGFIPFAEKWSAHVSVDAYRRADTDAFWLFGGEILYRDALAFRLGYAIRPDTKNGISCGLGVSFGMVVFDYGYSPRPAFDGGNHNVSIGLKF